MQNFPNPFSASSRSMAASTRIAFDLAEPVEVNVGVYNLLGQLVRLLQEEILPAGRHVVSWDGRDQNGGRVAAGFYVYRIAARKSGRTIWASSRQMSLAQ
jgi:flagellar hook assembly protein FlgD